MAREKAKDPRKDAPAKGRPAKAKDKAAPVVESPAATPLDAEVRRTRLKTLITLGKERGYLTYAEISDHLPDDVADAEQIEGIIATFNNMGIQVYDEAPAAEDLLMSDSVATNVDEDVAEEEAEQALSSVDSEFGRTTDPVRMYMREMGSVELLTREGEIEIAKRIEDGLKHMVQAISACPTTWWMRSRSKQSSPPSTTWQSRSSTKRPLSKICCSTNRRRRRWIRPKSRKKPNRPCRQLTRNSAAPPIRCACTCARWARSNC